MSAQKKTLAGKLLAVERAIGPVEKRGQAEEGYSFLRAVDVIAAVAPELSKRKILLTATTQGIQRDGHVTSVALQFTFEDVDTGEKRSHDWRGQGYDRAGNGLAKAYTAARKSFLKDTFNIAEPDDDPEAGPAVPSRTAGPSTIPADRVARIHEAAKASGIPDSILGAKLVDLGVVAIEGMTVDTAEAFEAWIAEEVAA